MKAERAVDGSRRRLLLAPAYLAATGLVPAACAGPRPSVRKSRSATSSTAATSGSVQPTGSPTGGPTVAAQVPLYKRCTFGIFYSGALGDSIDSPSPRGSYHLYEQALGVHFSRIVWYAQFATPLSPNAAAYGRGYRIVRAWNGMEYLAGRQSSGSKVPYSAILRGERDSSLHGVFASHAPYPGGTDFRMFWEMNLPEKTNSWTTTGQFIQTWRYIVDYSRKHFPRADFKFFWCPNSADGLLPDGSVAKMEYFWPGHNWVDAIGMDDYHNSAVQPGGTFSDFVTPYDRICAISDRYPAGYDAGSSQTPIRSHLPFYIGETATVAGAGARGADTAWYRSMFTSTAMPRLKAVDLFSSGEWTLDRQGGIPAVLRRYLPAVSTER